MGGSLRKPRKADAADFSTLPAPSAVASTAEPYGILVTGIGGTGVVTIGALLGMAAHLEGCYAAGRPGAALIAEGKT